MIKKGSIVTYKYPEAGWNFHKTTAKQYLKLGDAYEVTGVEERDSCLTLITLKGYDVNFQSSNFYVLL